MPQDCIFCQAGICVIHTPAKPGQFEAFRIVVAQPDEADWGVKKDRSKGLNVINSMVLNKCPHRPLVVFYPGSGDDLLHALFATATRATRFVFVDVNPSLVESFDMLLAAPRVENGARLSGKELGKAMTQLKITKVDPKKVVGWKFDFRDETRILILVIGGSKKFLEDNAEFRFDVFFEKDFWETSATNDLDWVLPHLTGDGLYVTNTSYGSLVSFLPQLGLQEECVCTLNGPMFVWRKTGVGTHASSDIRAALERAKMAAQMFLYGGDPDYNDLDSHLELTQAERLRLASATLQAAFDSLTHAQLGTLAHRWTTSQTIVGDIGVFSSAQLADALAAAKLGNVDRNIMITLAARLKPPNAK
ncbi:hypothetical protein [Hyalangium sp.]|uniref:hypothetical protein n=1 Tax=Hyalangium sp. TaxID=2028555 RepID=UPI002D640B83|nr:hypothetical protein [Hyalangium sp.]HYI02393.1 hypothetical protein [Hyalangium sp.]